MALAKIVYASMTGNTEEIADIVAKKLEELGHTVDVDECTTVDAADFEDADICIVATYTYGDGELPDEIVDFYEDLADLDLSGKIFGVVGSGDTFYDYFCHSVDEFENQFSGLGFCRCHRAFLCNLYYAEQIDRDTIWMTNGVQIPISRSRQREVNECMISYYLG